MNHPPNTPEKRRHTLMSFGFALALFGCCGCAAHLATVKIKTPRLSATVASEASLGPATEFLAAAKNEQPLSALGHDLLAARISANVLERFPNNESARNIYNFSAARIVQDTARAGIEPWRHPINIGTGEGKYVFSSPKPADAEHDPSRYDLFPTDTLEISGRFFKTRSRASGIGAPLVAVGREENPRFRQQYKLRRVYAPATAVIQFSGRKADLKFVDPFQAKRVVLDKRNFPLAVDLSAPTAMLIARERPERLGFARAIDPQKYADTARLTQLQPYDPARTPVIFVHGLQETPASWTPMIDSLRNDPWIREHYQFWVYSYPSGYPYPYSAALFRQDLDGIDRAFPNHKRVVLIGHSMGGMICRLMITDAGDKIWRDFFSTPPSKTPLASDTRRLLEESLVFNHRPDVDRVIFISTPHRGSRLASGWIGRVGAALVRTPRLFTAVYASAKPILVSDPAARTLKRMPNSVDTLEPNDRFVQAVDKLPITRGIPYHSIMGDRGRGNTPNSSDGVVPYWSSHLDRAQSELIVDSGHDAQSNPEAIREVARILKESPAVATR
jgi:pimeloyl-ACP methyl ester carboxylesterase